MAPRPPGRPEENSRATPLSLLERARAADRDEDAWRRLVALYRPLVRFWCARSGVRAADQDDVVQEVFAAVARHLGEFRRDRPGDSFRGWLRVITRNQVLLSLRRGQGQARAEGGSQALRKLQEVPDALAGPSPEEDEQMKQVYQRALEQVRGEFEECTWRAFWLTAIEGRQPAALAAELGVTAGAIRQAKSRVLRRLREEMGDVLG